MKTFDPKIPDLPQSGTISGIKGKLASAALAASLVLLPAEAMSQDAAHESESVVQPYVFKDYQVAARGVVIAPGTEVNGVHYIVSSAGIYANFSDILDISSEDKNFEADMTEMVSRTFDTFFSGKDRTRLVIFLSPEDAKGRLWMLIGRAVPDVKVQEVKDLMSGWIMIHEPSDGVNTAHIIGGTTASVTFLLAGFLFFRKKNEGVKKNNPKVHPVKWSEKTEECDPHLGPVTVRMWAEVKKPVEERMSFADKTEQSRIQLLQTKKKRVVEHIGKIGIKIDNFIKAAPHRHEAALKEHIKPFDGAFINSVWFAVQPFQESKWVVPTFILSMKGIENITFINSEEFVKYMTDLLQKEYDKMIAAK